MDVFGFALPLWAVFLGIIIIAIIVWKLIKFAIKMLIIVVVFFGILLGLDLIGFFNLLQDVMTNFV